MGMPTGSPEGCGGSASLGRWGLSIGSGPVKKDTGGQDLPRQSPIPQTHLPLLLTGASLTTQLS